MTHFFFVFVLKNVFWELFQKAPLGFDFAWNFLVVSRLDLFFPMRTGRPLGIDENDESCFLRRGLEKTGGTKPYFSY